MNTAAYVDELIEKVKIEDIPVSEKCWQVAMACKGYAYVYGAYGEYCDPSNRRSRYSDEHPKIKERCKNFNGRDDRPAGCVGCQWFLGDAESKAHEGRTRFFDCRGYIYFVLHKVCGMWSKCPAGCTTMWNTASNWTAKGTIDSVPEDILVCLFQQSEDKPKTMEHIGFGYKGETLECQNGVEYHKTRNKKWTHWAIPVCVDAVPQPDPEPVPGTVKPTLRKGDAGPYVTLAQTELIQRGYDLGSWGADGKFGSATERAVKQFQQDWGLSIDGVIGPRTWEMLDTTPVKITYTVTIPHMSLADAEALVKLYPGSTMKKEGDA